MTFMQIWCLDSMAKEGNIIVISSDGNIIRPPVNPVMKLASVPTQGSWNVIWHVRSNRGQPVHVSQGDEAPYGNASLSTKLVQFLYWGFKLQCKLLTARL